MPASGSDLDPMARVVGKDFKRGPVPGFQRRRRPSRPFQYQSARGELAVEAPLLAAGRVVIAQAHEGILGRVDAAFDLDARRARSEIPVEVPEAPTRPA